MRLVPTGTPSPFENTPVAALNDFGDSSTGDLLHHAMLTIFVTELIDVHEQKNRKPCHQHNADIGINTGQIQDGKQEQRQNQPAA